MSWRDFKEVARSLSRTRLFSSFVVLLLAVGIGANTLVFTAVNALLLRPLRVNNPKELVRLGLQRSPTLISFDHPYLYTRVLNRQGRSFAGIFATWSLEMALTSGNQLESITGATASGRYF